MRSEIRRDLMRLSRRMQGVEELDVWPPVRPTDRQLAEFVQRNQQGLDEARRVIDAYGARLVALSEEEGAWPSLDEVTDGQGVRGLIMAMSYAMESAIRARDLMAAKDWAFDLFLLTCLIRNGGLLVESLLSLACEGFAIRGLRKIRDEFALTCAAETIASLQHHCQVREPLERILERDEQWSVCLESRKEEAKERSPDEILEEFKAHMLEDDIPEDAAEFCTEQLRSAMSWSKSELDEQMRRGDNRPLAKLHLLLAEIGVSAFRHGHDRLPDSLDELCPEFLPAVPPDPFTGDPLIYRRVDDAYLLYSTGDKGYDGGGEMLPLDEVIHGSGDLFLDTVARGEIL